MLTFKTSEFSFATSIRKQPQLKEHGGRTFKLSRAARGVNELLGQERLTMAEQERRLDLLTTQIVGALGPENPDLKDAYVALTREDGSFSVDVVEPNHEQPSYAWKMPPGQPQVNIARNQHGATRVTLQVNTKPHSGVGRHKSHDIPSVTLVSPPDGSGYALAPIGLRGLAVSQREPLVAAVAASADFLCSPGVADQLTVRSDGS